jgi:cation:H+ antiporter
MNLILDLLIFLISSFVLIKTADELVEASSRIAKSFGLNEFIIGMTIVAIGTSLPELSASITAVLLNSPGIAIGNVIGSNIANILLVIGLIALIKPISTKWKEKKKDSIILIIITFLSIIFLITGNSINQIEGFILILFFPISMYFILKEHSVHLNLNKKIILMDWIIVGISLIFLIASSSLFIGSAKNIAIYFSLSETIIGMTLVALSTSLPELVSAGMAALKNKPALAVGDIIGSNLFNISVVLGSTALIQSIPIETSIYFFELPLMLLATLALIYFIKKEKIPKLIGEIFFIVYIIFVLRSIGII